MQGTLKRVLDNWQIFAVLLLGFGVRLVGLLPNIHHPDEAHVENYSHQLVLNALTKGDLNPHTFKYGSLIFYLQAIVYVPIVFFKYFFNVLNTIISSANTSKILSIANMYPDVINENSDLFVWAGRSVAAIFGGLTVLLTYKLAKRLFSKKVALLSALIVALSPMHSRDSRYITTDVLFTFFVLLSFYYMVRVFETRSTKWFALSGFLVGFSSTIRFFPISGVVVPFVLMFTFHKKRVWFFNSLINLLSIPLGIFVGVPFLFFGKENFEVFKYEMERWVLPWYKTGISDFASGLAGFIASGGKTDFPSFQLLVPTHFYPVYLNEIFFNLIGPIGSAAIFIGIVSSLRRSPKIALMLILIPLATWVYSSFYITATYERLILPATPFLAVFSAIGVWFIVDYVHNKWGLTAKHFFAVTLISLTILPISFKTIPASIACNQPMVYNMGGAWVDREIPGGKSIAIVPLVLLPSTKDFTKISNVRPNIEFSLEELAGHDYVYLNLGTLDTYNYLFRNNYFLPPQELKGNAFLQLALQEYQNRAVERKIFEKPYMCDGARLAFYEMKPQVEEARNQVVNMGFDNVVELEGLIIQKFGQPNETSLDIAKEATISALRIENKKVQYVGSRVVFGIHKAIAGKRYTLKAKVRFEGNLDENKRDGLLRIDFYKSKSNLEKAGEFIALTPRYFGSGEWKELKVTTVAPELAGDLVYSFQSGTQGTYYLDDVTLLEE